MQKLDTNITAFALEDTSEVIAVERLVVRFDASEQLKERVSGVLGKVINNGISPEKERFDGEVAEFIIGCMQTVINEANPRDDDLPAVKEMLLEFENHEQRFTLLELAAKREMQLRQSGEPPISAKLRPLRAWRAPSANYDTADQPKIAA